jgi:hypothetical protein
MAKSFYFNDTDEIDISEILKQSDTKNLIDSKNFLNFSRLLNIIFSILIIIIGLIGNLLTIKVLSNKRFRTNQNDIYLFCLAIIDTIFLITHFFEDTIKTYNDLFNEYPSKLIKIFNILDKSNLACWLINYIRHISCLISANILVVLTVQRLITVLKPFSVRLKTKKSAWIMVVCITVVSICVCIWIPFLFKRQKNNYCRMDENKLDLYRIINIIYVVLLILAPIFIICVSNVIIIYKTFRNDSNRQSTRTESRISNTINYRKKHSLLLKQVSKSEVIKLRPYYLTIQQVINKAKNNSKKNSKKLTIMLILVTFSCVALNLPYLIVWSLYFKSVYFDKFSLINYYNFLAMLKLSEVFFIINYSLKFYLYCVASSNFRKQLNYSSIYSIF